MVRGRSTRECFKRLHEALGGQNPIILHDIARSHTAATVADLLRRWQWEILELPTLLTLTFNYDFFAKEPLRGARYNTRDVLSRAIGRSIRNIKNDGRTDGARRLINI